MIEAWRKISSRLMGDFRIFKVRSEIRKSPRTGADHDFFLIDCVNWVNVIALTANDELVMVDQYRHGSDTVELEAPGGMIDPEDASPLEAGLRELREETGYEGSDAVMIGEFFPNPAIQTNVCYTILVQNCRRVAEVKFDQTEDLQTRLISLDAIPDLVAAGKIRHALVLDALFYFELWRRRVGRS
jgi:8-oxo-dGTP pyrophosphatase MutT (NUDIX family)